MNKEQAQTAEMLQEIKTRAKVALDFAWNCDRTNSGCQVPQVLKVVQKDIPYLLALVESLQRERDNPQPLTIEELSALASEDPVWGSHCFVKNIESGKVFHALVDVDSRGIVVMIGAQITLLLETYGTLWLAYATEPKGDEAK